MRLGKSIIGCFLAWATFCLSIIPTLVQAQQCDNKYTSNNERFFVNGDGTVTDIDAGLTWMRCAAGQQWNGKTCAGQARLLTWDEARQQVQGNTSHWRLPRLTELASIVDMGCRSPRINLDLFPSTTPQAFWTINKAPGNTHHIYILSFGAGGVSQAKPAEKHFLRLVRGRD